MGHAQYDTDGFDQAAASRPRERVAVKGCIFKDGRLLFLFKPDAARRLSIAPDLEEDLPGGCVEAGESWQEALVREVREETGLEIEVGEPFDAWTLRAPGRRILGVDFVCRWRSGDVRLSHEHESFAWLTLEEVEAKGWEAEPFTGRPSNWLRHEGVRTVPDKPNSRFQKYRKA